MEIGTISATLALVTLGTIAHVFKKVVEGRQENKSLSLRVYLGLYPYKTALMLITAIGTAWGLFAAGQLNEVTAFGVGYISQSVSGAAGNK